MEPKAPEKIQLHFCKTCGHALDDVKYLCTMNCPEDGSVHKNTTVVTYVRETV